MLGNAEVQLSHPQWLSEKLGLGGRKKGKTKVWGRTVRVVLISSR